MSDIFCVRLTTGAGDMIPYKGIRLKRGPPSDDKYILIKAKSFEKNKVNLSRAYRMNSPGTYSVQLKMSLNFREDQIGTILTQNVDSNTEEFVVEQTGAITESRIEQAGTSRLSHKKPPCSGPQGPKSPKLVGHYPNSSDREETTKAYKLAYSAIEGSIPRTTGDRRLYRTWFGVPYNSKVQSNYATMKSAMENTEFTLHACPTKEENEDTPEGSYFGFAYTPEPPSYSITPIIYLGDLYFKARQQGGDSKMGVIVHEMSHAAAGTHDVTIDGDEVYGSGECRDLAKNHPEMARDNADNYEYFSEAIYPESRVACHVLWPVLYVIFNILDFKVKSCWWNLELCHTVQARNLLQWVKQLESISSGGIPQHVKGVVNHYGCGC